MKRSPVSRTLILDANVLIDYARSELSILELAARHLGSVLIPLPILEEVDQLTEEDCARLGMSVIEPTLEELTEAASGGGKLSFQDHLCLNLARKGGLTCVTNDNRLRRECTASGVQVLWGLEVMSELVAEFVLPAEVALTTATAIHEINPRHITDEILRRFETRVKNVGHDR